MYNKYMTLSLKEYNKIQKCIETSETPEDFMVCNNMRDLFLDKLNTRLYTLYKSKNWIHRLINKDHKSKVHAFDDMATLMMEQIDNTLQPIFDNINECQADQIRRDKHQLDIISDSEAYREGYKPHVVVTGFKIND